MKITTIILYLFVSSFFILTSACTHQIEKTDKETLNSDGVPEIKILYPDGGKFEQDKPINIKYQIANIPSGSGIVLILVRDVPASERWKYYGPTGPLMLRPEPISGAGEKSFKWNGKEVGCAPTDAPMWCQGIEPGSYYITAKIYNRNDFSILGWPDNSPKEIIAEDQTPSFTIEGEVNLKPLTDKLTASVEDFVKEKFQFYSFGGTQVSSLYLKAGKIFKQKDEYCIIFDLLPPFEGQIKACSPLYGGYDEITVSGTPSYAQGVLAYSEALKKAHEVADAPYLSRVKFDHQPTMEEAGYNWESSSSFTEWSQQNPDATTYLSSGVTNWAYRNDGYWVFILYETKAGGQATGPDRFAYNVLVRVDNKGNSCVVKTSPYHSPLEINIFEDKIVCQG